MNNTIIKFFSVLVAFTTFSCKSPIDKIGPDLCPSDDFSFGTEEIVLEGLDNNGGIDLGSNGLTVKSYFTEEVKWTLKIVSNLAVKEYSGKGDSINVTWYGNVDYFPLFDLGEARVELEIACREMMEKKFTITGKPTFKNLKADYGILIRDFDKNGFVPVLSDDYVAGDGWAGLNGKDTSYYSYFDNDPSQGGGKHGVLYSKNDETTWYHGATSFAIPNFEGKLSTDNADSVYVNFFCKGFGLENTGLEFGLTSAGTNYFYTTPIDWEGWKLISIKLSEMKVLSGARAGEKLSEPSKISQCILQLGSNPIKTAEAKSAYDFIILTVGEPFANN